MHWLCGQLVSLLELVPVFADPRWLVHRKQFTQTPCSAFRTASQLTQYLFTSSQTSGSIVAPLDSYLNNDICNTDACSTDSLSSANQTINDNCQDDIQNGNTLITALRTVISQYPTIREVACLQASG